jgi:hypothetical protein
LPSTTAVSHGRYTAFQMGAAISRNLFTAIPRLIAEPLSGAWRAHATGVGAPEHHGDDSTLTVIVKQGTLCLKISSSGGCQ